MIGYIVRRCLQAIPLLLVVSAIGFAIIHGSGDPLAAYTQDAGLSSADLARLRHHYGLDQSLPVQYASWLKNILVGDWGTSYYTQESALSSVLDALPNTLVLAGVAYAVILSCSIALGIATAVRRYSVFDHVVTTLSFAGIAVPSFWLGLMLIIVFAVQFRIAGLPYFPVGGMYDARLPPSVAQLLWHVVLPAVTLAFVVTARYIRYIRASVLEHVRRDYVRTARAKGLSGTRVLWRHVFKNALLPLITLIGLDIPNLLSGTIVIETIFAWPGMGRLFWSSAEHSDVPVLMMIMMVVAALTVLSNLAADVCYAVADPRIRY